MIPAEDGTHLFYEVRGRGPALVLCNGLLCQRSHWRHQIEYFENKFQVVTFDYRGHHASQYPSNDRHMTLEWCARDAAHIASELGLGRFVLVGHSMGVPIAARAAHRTRDRVAGMVLICGSVSNPFESMFFTHRMNAVYRVTDRLYEIAPGLVTHFWKRMTRMSPLSYFLTAQLGFNAQLADKKDVILYIEGVHQNRLDTFYQLLRDYTRPMDSGWLSQISCPALVLAGEEDCVTPAEIIKGMADRIPGAEFMSIAGGSHNAHADLPRVVNHRIERFLEKIAFA